MCNKATKWTWPWGAPSHRSRSHFASGYRAAQPWSLGGGLMLAASPAGATVPPVPVGPGHAGGQQLLGQGSGASHGLTCSWWCCSAAVPAKGSVIGVCSESRRLCSCCSCCCCCLGLPALRACAQGARTVPAAELNTFDSIYYLKIMQLGRVLAIFYA